MIVENILGDFDKQATSFLVLFAGSYTRVQIFRSLAGLKMPELVTEILQRDEIARLLCKFGGNRVETSAG